MLSPLELINRIARVMDEANVPREDRSLGFSHEYFQKLKRNIESVDDKKWRTIVQLRVRGFDIKIPKEELEKEFIAE